MELGVGASKLINWRGRGGIGVGSVECDVTHRGEAWKLAMCTVRDGAAAWEIAHSKFERNKIAKRFSNSLLVHRIL